MAHELDIQNGRAAMAYVGETPWHGLGQSLLAGADIETWKKAAGMDWQIKRSVVRYATQHADNVDPTESELGLLKIPDQHILFREDNRAALGLVSSRYKIVQPGEVLEFFSDLVGDAGFTLNTAGVLFGGKKFWALASIGESANIIGHDKVDGYLLLSTSCDGSLATEARFTTVRVVCNNTLSMATSIRDTAARVSVSHRLAFDHNAVKDRLGVARGNFAHFIGAARELADKPVNPQKAEVLTARLLGQEIATAQSIDDKVRESRQFRKILALFNGDGMGSTLPGVQGTAWGWVNAVTEATDHHAKAQSTDHRLNAAWFGKGDAMKTQAMELALMA